MGDLPRQAGGGSDEAMKLLLRHLRGDAVVQNAAALHAGQNVGVAFLSDLAVVEEGVDLSQHRRVDGSRRRSSLMDGALIDAGAESVLNDHGAARGLSQGWEGEAKGETGGDERAKHGGSPAIEGGEFLESNS